MPKKELFESQIQDSLLEAANRVEASDLLKSKIHSQLSNEQNTEVSMKKVFSIKKVLILAAAVCCLVTATVFAAGTISHYVTFSDRNDAFTQIPSTEKLKQDLGFAPKIMESFSNGYKFKEATIFNTSGQSEDDQTLSKFKELNTVYTSADGREVTLTSNNQPGNSYTGPVAGQTKEYNGIHLSYSSQVYKFVPPDYQMTQEDKEAVKDGSIVFSDGSDKVETITYQNASWTDGNMNYMLMTQNTALTDKDLFQMAEELIDSKN